MQRTYIPFLTFIMCALSLPAADWPAYQNDNQRTGITQEKLTLPLHNVWTRTSAHPTPAWIPQTRTGKTKPFSNAQGFDRVYHTVITGGLLYYGSSTDDTVYCIDARTGKAVWSFITDGPIRIPPAAANGKVYAGSDDGHLYCLDAETGALQWKYRAFPESPSAPLTCIGNGRLISSWPIRCGIIIKDGTVYFTSGIFPSRGVLLHALNANTGEKIWTEKISQTAQGHLLATGNFLYIPSGRNTPIHSYSMTNGQKSVTYGRNLKRGPYGGSLATASGNTVVAGPSESGNLHYFAIGKPKDIKSLTKGAAVLVDDSIAYAVAGDILKGSRYALKAFSLSSTNKVSHKELWSNPAAQAFSMIKAGNMLIVGGLDEVTAYDLKGRKIWTGKTDGAVYGLAVSNGRLFTSTESGQISCFGPENPASSSQESVSVITKDEFTSGHESAAKEAIAAAGTEKGFCLLLDSGDGRLAYEIAKRSEFRIVAMESDLKKVAASRKFLHKTGMYGSRITVHHVKSEKLSLPQYFANLIITDNSSYSADELMKHLRPYGGVMILPSGTTKRGALKGAGEWTHIYSDPGNSSSSQDKLVNGTMDILWFGAPGPEEQINRHYRNVPPLFKNGILYVAGNEVIHGVDAYNGTLLWRRDIQDSRRTGAFLDAGSMALDDKYLYVASAGSCVALDPFTGMTKKTFRLPEEESATKDWGCVVTVNDTLIGSSCKKGAAHSILDGPSNKLLWYLKMPNVTSQAIFGSDISTGRTKWAYRAGLVVNSTISCTDKNVYFIETTSPASITNSSGKLTSKKLFSDGEQFLVSLDINSGKTKFRNKIDASAFTEPVFMSSADDILLLSGSRPISNTLHYSYYAFSSETGELIWTKKHQAYKGIADGGHGEQNRHPTIMGDTVLAWPNAYKLASGEKVEEWNMNRRGHGCGGISASAENIFWRGHNPWMLNIKSGSRAVRLTDVTRPGCWINIIPAGGLLMIPEGSSSCTCGYSIQTSLTLVPR